MDRISSLLTKRINRRLAPKPIFVFRKQNVDDDATVVAEEFARACECVGAVAFVFTASAGVTGTTGASPSSTSSATTFVATVGNIPVTQEEESCNSSCPVAPSCCFDQTRHIQNDKYVNIFTFNNRKAAGNDVSGSGSSNTTTARDDGKSDDSAEGIINTVSGAALSFVIKTKNNRNNKNKASDDSKDKNNNNNNNTLVVDDLSWQMHTTVQGMTTHTTLLTVTACGDVIVEPCGTIPGLKWSQVRGDVPKINTKTCQQQQQARGDAVGRNNNNNDVVTVEVFQLLPVEEPSAVYDGAPRESLRPMLVGHTVERLINMKTSQLRGGGKNLPSVINIACVGKTIGDATNLVGLCATACHFRGLTTRCTSTSTVVNHNTAAADHDHDGGRRPPRQQPPQQPVSSSRFLVGQPLDAIKEFFLFPLSLEQVTSSSSSSSSFASSTPFHGVLTCASSLADFAAVANAAHKFISDNHVALLSDVRQCCSASSSSSSSTQKKMDPSVLLAPTDVGPLREVYTQARDAAALATQQRCCRRECRMACLDWADWDNLSFTDWSSPPVAVLRYAVVEVVTLAISMAAAGGSS